MGKGSKKKKNNKPRPIKPTEVKRMKKDITKDATKHAFILMLSIPTLVIKTKFGKLWRREVDGKGRAERFIDYCLDIYEEYSKDAISLEHLVDTLEQETGVRLE